MGDLSDLSEAYISESGELAAPEQSTDLLEEPFIPGFASTTKVIIETSPCTITLEGPNVTADETYTLWCQVMSHLSAREMESGGFGFADTSRTPDVSPSSSSFPAEEPEDGFSE